MASIKSNASALVGPARSGAPTSTANLGYQGYSPQQTTKGYNNYGDALTRRILRNGWNTQYAVGSMVGANGQRIAGSITPFRAVNNSGDFLNRINYSCGGPNPQNIDRPGLRNILGSVPQQCDGTGIPPSTCNPRFVADSSDYTTFKRQQAINYNYNDLSPVGNDSNGSFVPLMAIRR